jgi:hypothetical protein
MYPHGRINGRKKSAADFPLPLKADQGIAILFGLRVP